MTDTAAAFRDNAALGRYEMGTPAGLAFIDYRITGGVISLDHAETPAAARGGGVAARMVLAAFDDIRARGLKMAPRCSYVAAVAKRHPEYADIVADV